MSYIQGQALEAPRDLKLGTNMRRNEKGNDTPERFIHIPIRITSPILFYL